LALRPSNPQNPTAPAPERQQPQDEAFLREVDDALREDEMLGAFKRYGLPIGALVLAGLLAFAAYLWWDGHSKDQAAERGEKFTLALDKVEAGRLDSGDKQLQELAADGSGGTQAAAVLLRAGIALEQKRTGDALKLFAQVSADSSAPQPFRDLATIREVATNFDAMPVDQIITRLKPLAVPGNPWFGSAGELLGIAYLKQGHATRMPPNHCASVRASWPGNWASMLSMMSKNSWVRLRQMATRQLFLLRPNKQN